MFRSFQQTLDAIGSGSISVRPSDVAVEWDIYQISIQTQATNYPTTCDILWNNFFLCTSFQGWKDCATGPPDIVVGPSDFLLVNFSGGKPNDVASIGVWYNENPTGQTYSTAH